MLRKASQGSKTYAETHHHAVNHGVRTERRGVKQPGWGGCPGGDTERGQRG